MNKTKINLSDSLQVTNSQDITGFVFNEKGIPVVNKKEYYPLINATIKALVKLNFVKTESENNKSKVIEIAEPIYEKLMGDIKSIKFNNAHNAGIIVTYADSYKLADGAEDTIRKSLNEKEFNDNFEIKLEAKTDKILELKEIFTKAFGDETKAIEKMSEIFETTREVVVKKGMDKRFKDLPEIVKKSLVQRKASVSLS